MADIAKINLEGTSYNIKDNEARSELYRLNNGITLLIGDSYELSYVFPSPLTIFTNIRIPTITTIKVWTTGILFLPVEV